MFTILQSHSPTSIWLLHRPDWGGTGSGVRKQAFQLSCDTSSMGNLSRVRPQTGLQCRIGWAFGGYSHFVYMEEHPLLEGWGKQKGNIAGILQAGQGPRYPDKTRKGPETQPAPTLGHPFHLDGDKSFPVEINAGSLLRQNWVQVSAPNTNKLGNLVEFWNLPGPHFSPWENQMTIIPTS